MLSSLNVPFVPSSWDRIQIMLQVSDVKKGDKTVDLGSGDGRVVIEMAKREAQAHGYEINPSLIAESLEKAEKENLLDKVYFHLGNYWKKDLSSFDIVTIYGMTSIMERMEKKLQSELKPGARVISNFFQFPNWPHTEKRGEIYLYKMT